MRNRQGITLMVLAITIIILLLLAGIAIGSFLSNDGIINKTKGSNLKNRKSEYVLTFIYIIFLSSSIFSTHLSFLCLYIFSPYN